MGGFAHGVTGIGWALTRLARATGSARHSNWHKRRSPSKTLFDEQEQNWRDLRMLENAKTAAAWCHGAVGIGLAHLIWIHAYPGIDTESRASGRRSNLAAGDGLESLRVSWRSRRLELLDHAIAAGEAPKELSASYLLDVILTSLEQDGPSCGMGRNAFAPGLLPGLGGVAYHCYGLIPSMICLRS